MLGKRGAQRGMLEADTMYLDFVGRDTFYGFLAAQRGELFRDEDFAELYHVRVGRPSVAPSLLATALVLQHYDGVSDDEARRRAAFDLQWKVALGLPVDSRPFAKSTLQEFRAQLVVHEQQGAIFQRSLDLAKQRGHFKGQRKLTLALDTTNILGRGAVKDTYYLLADGIVQVLRVLAEQTGEPVGETADRLAYDCYVTGSSLKGQAEIDWSDAAARRRFLAGIVADAERLLGEVREARGRLPVDSPQDRALVEAAGLLSRVLAQDIERRDDGPDLRIGVTKDRMPSVHDPEMRHGRKSKAKRFDGHKLQLGVDTESQLVTAVAVIPGNAPDREQALQVVEQSEERTGVKVAETLGDCAYGDGLTRHAFAAAKRPLIAKAPALTNQGHFTKAQFRIEVAGGTCTCPAAQVTTDFRPSPKGGGVFHFAATVCGPCPLREQCVRGKAGRTVQVHPQEELLQAARAFQASPAFAPYRALRQVVEHRIARLVQLGIRQARYCGRKKTLFQACMAAAVANLTLLATSGGAGALIHLAVALSRLTAPLRGSLEQTRRSNHRGRPAVLSTRRLPRVGPVSPKIAALRPGL